MSFVGRMGTGCLEDGLKAFSWPREGAGGRTSEMCVVKKQNAWRERPGRRPWVNRRGMFYRVSKVELWETILSPRCFVEGRGRYGPVVRGVRPGAGSRCATTREWGLKGAILVVPGGGQAYEPG